MKIAPHFVFAAVVMCSIAEAEMPAFTSNNDHVKLVDINGIPGSLVLAGGGSLPKEILDTFVELAGGSQAHLVLIPTASIRADEGTRKELLGNWKHYSPASFKILHARSRTRSNERVFTAAIENATGVWISGGNQGRLAKVYSDTRVAEKLVELLQRGGVIGGTSAGAAIQSRVMIAGGKREPTLMRGIDLLPDSIVDQHFMTRNRPRRLLLALNRHPRRFGIGIDEQTAAIVKGRTIEVLGKSTVSVLFAENTRGETETLLLKTGDRADLTALRRQARQTQEPSFPPTDVSRPSINSGTLFIVGGGLTKELALQFINLLPSTEELIVVIPTADSDPLPDQPSDLLRFRDVGASNVQLLKTRIPMELDNRSTRALLEKASAIWFSGGRQWRLVDLFEGTKALTLIRDVLCKQGVIGGSSAGASIQAQYLVRGDPLGNRNVMAAGYTRGFNFLPGTAIDQHMLQRDRFGDMIKVIQRYPQLLGIGIDERTAVVIRGSQATVTGRHQVHFFNAPSGEYQSLSAGQSYELIKRRRIQ
ncbi:MAG: cyanophycinase [Planctomycetota bacterium]|nr:cyanophycinase [Planctomycetota bacterium]